MPAPRTHRWSTSLGRGLRVRLVGSALLVSFAAVTLRSASAQDVGNGKPEGPMSVKLSRPSALPGDLVGRPVIKVDVVTAGGRWQVREQLRTPLGQPLSAAYARAIARELLGTGRYADAQIA